jgi:transcriptional regulator with XRE-family HTH domain
MAENGTYLEKLGLKLRALREEQGLSQEELAQLADLHRTYVGGIERGERNITILSLLKLAHALQVHPARLLEEVQ